MKEIIIFLINGIWEIITLVFELIKNFIIDIFNFIKDML